MIQLAKIFQDGMTFQRKKACRIWGTSSEAQMAAVYINDRKVAEKELPQGKFSFLFPPQEAAQNVSVRIGADVSLRHVDFGEVWFAGGQSNMEFPMKYDAAFEEMKDCQPDEHLRYYEVGKYSFQGEREEGLKDGKAWDCWRFLNRDSIGDFSAVALYFAREIRERLGVPVAVVSCSWGGTSASAWVGRSMLESDAGLAVYLQEYEKNLEHMDLEKYYQIHFMKRKNMCGPFARMINDYMMKNTVTMEQVMQYVGKLAGNAGAQMQEGAAGGGQMSPEAFMLTGPYDENRPCGLYETMLSEVAGYTVQGVIWYQGESDDVHPELYEKLFASLVGQIREDWGEELPVIYAQLAPFESWMQAKGERFPELRRQQFKAWEHIRNIHMISCSDCGNRFDIHPKNKQPVGLRMALSAGAHVYGETLRGDAPVAAGMKLQGRQIDLWFDNADSLHLDGEELRELEVYADGERCAITGWDIEGNGLKLFLDRDVETKKTEVIFAQTPYYQVNLYNEAGLPAFPFALRQN